MQTIELRIGVWLSPTYSAATLPSASTSTRDPAPPPKGLIATNRLSRLNPVFVDRLADEQRVARHARMRVGHHDVSDYFRKLHFCLGASDAPPNAPF